MQRASEATARKLVGAIGLALTLPVSFSATAVAHAATSNVAERVASAQGSSSMPGRWQAYALASITPGFSWATGPGASESEPHVFDAVGDVRAFAFALSTVGQEPTAYFGLSIATHALDERPVNLSLPAEKLGSELPRLGLQRTVVAPSYIQRWGNSGSFGVTAVLAYQRFVTLGLGEVSVLGDSPIWPAMPGETSYGGGLRVDAGNSLGERLAWNVAYQSRVNMDAFNTYRGVYSEPGQFDIPASATVMLSYALTPSLSFEVGAQRVMYGNVPAFTNPALPRRFLVLLGTGASPEFAWQDLDVYSAGWTFRDRAFGELELRYTTRQQPLPSSALLRNALDADPADHTVALGYARGVGAHARMSLRAVYSSEPYFIGVPSYRARNDVTGSNIEFEALWALRF